MNYIDQINLFWRKHEEDMFGPTEIALYFHLLDISNKSNWTNPFKRRNTKICADLGIAKATLDRARNRLKQSGIIDFFSKGKGDTNIVYVLNNEEKYRKKFKNNTSPDTTVDTTVDTLVEQHNINLKHKPKTVEEVELGPMLIFFKQTQNFRMLSEKYMVDAEEHFKIFFNSKIDLGEFENKTKEDIVRHFSMWLPKYLTGTKKDFESKKKPFKKDERGIEAALSFGNVKMR